MPIKTLPANYPAWRTDAADRAEDAAYTFGYHLVRHCRDEAIASVPSDCSPEVRAAAEHAVDLALHNVMDLLEGFWPLQSGESHSVEYVLKVRVRDTAGNAVENVELSPAKLDLPIGYWKWAREGDFR
jgi:hypothetical protein